MSEQKIETAKPSKIKYILPLSLLVVALCCLIVVIVAPIGKRKAKPKEESTEISFPVPAFTLNERAGGTVTREDLLGKVWAASFIFTRCTGPCPSVSATMAKLQQDLNLAERDDVRLVSFTVDPGRDGVKELAKYADNFQAHPTKWLFLTGSETELHQLMSRGFMLGVKRSTAPSVVDGQEFDHSTLIAVVDKKNIARGYFDGYRGPNDENGEKYNQRYAGMKTLIEQLLKE